MHRRLVQSEVGYPGNVCHVHKRPDTGGGRWLGDIQGQGGLKLSFFLYLCNAKGHLGSYRPYISGSREGQNFCVAQFTIIKDRTGSVAATRNSGLASSEKYAGHKGCRKQYNTDKARASLS